MVERFTGLRVKLGGEHILQIEFDLSIGLRNNSTTIN
jgi:hypothetical protein